MSGNLILVKHSLPKIIEHVPAREWILSEEGRMRAARLAERLISYHPEKLVSSPEPKAMETAQIIALKCGVELHILDDLHEHERSTVPYLSKMKFDKAVHEFFSNADRLVFGSETADQAHERFSGAVHSVLAENENRTSMIVSHGTVISLFVSRLTRQPDFRIWSELGLPGFIVLDTQSNKLIAFENIL